MDYAAAISVVHKVDQITVNEALGEPHCLRVGLVFLLVAGALLPHLYFRYVAYRIGSTATE